MKEINVQEPNFTQLPNAVLDSMCEFTDAELRVVLAISRQTFGWHRERHKMSISFMCKATGLSHQGIINACFRLMEKKVIQRQPMGDSFTYNLLVDGIPTSPSTQLTAPQPGLPPLVNPVDCPPSTQLTQINKGSNKQTNAPGKPVPPVFKVKPESIKRLFTDRWCSEFKAVTGTPYLFQGAKDGTAADRVLKAGFDLEEFFRVARIAWKQTNDKQAWWCVTQSRELATFVGGWNKIKGEVDLMQKRSMNPTTIGGGNMQSQPGGGSNGRF